MCETGLPNYATVTPIFVALYEAMISDDEHLEFIVGDIHAVTTENGEATWNETIDGSQ